MPRRSNSEPAKVPAPGIVVEFPAPAKAKNPAAVALGRLGGAKGGRRRAEKLTEEERKAIARQGGLARQAKARIMKMAEAGTSDQGSSS